MHMLTQDYFSIRLFVHSLKSWSVFWVKVQTTTISHWQTNQEQWKFEKIEDININQLSLPFLPEIKSHTKKMTISQGHLLLSKSIWKSFEERKRRKNTKPKQNRRLLKNFLQGQLSMECILVFRLPTHAEHQKLGLSLSPILTGSGYCGATGAVLNSNTLSPAGRINTNTSWSNRRGCPFYLAFIFLSHTLKHLILVQFSNSAVQRAAYFFIHVYHLPCCCTVFPLEHKCWVIIGISHTLNNFLYWQSSLTHRC